MRKKEVMVFLGSEIGIRCWVVENDKEGLGSCE